MTAETWADTQKGGRFDPLNVNALRFDLTPNNPPADPGSMFWDADDKTVALVMPDGVTLQIGQETQIIATNRTGATIPNGRPVYVSGAQGNRVTIALADADSAPAWCVIGVTTQDIPNNESGKVTALGMVRDIDTSAFVEGATLYLDTTAGGLVSTAPGYPATRWLVGFVARSHAVNGSIFVAPQRLSPYVRREAAVTTEPGENVANPSLGNWVNADMQLPYFPGSVTKRMYYAVDLNHDYVPGTDLVWHLHFGATTANAGNVRWQIYWQWDEAGGVSIPATLAGVTMSAGGVAWNDLRADFAIPGAGHTYNSRLLVHVFRDPADGADTYPDAVALKSANCHYIADPLQAG